MKPSQKSLLYIIGAIASVIVLSTITLRVAISSVDNDFRDRPARLSNLHDLRDFDEVRISGVWDVEIIQSEDWKVQANLEELEDADIEIYVENEHLVLRQRSFHNFWEGTGEDAEIRIEMPDLKRIRASGGSEVQLTGFSGEDLDVSVSGAIELEGRDGMYENFNLDASGAVEIELEEMAFTNANIDISGAGELTLNMNGGSLLGQVSGAAEINYFGTVAEENIDISGTADINHRK